jgi:Fe-S-cluster containining protein
MFSDFTLVYTETYATRSLALKREAELKKWPKNRKESLIDSCFQCGICCRLFCININEEEWRSGQFETIVQAVDTNEEFSAIEQYGGNILKQKPDGSCMYLNGSLCSIHKKRPQVCREFFCTSNNRKFKDMISFIKKHRENDTIRSC